MNLIPTLKILVVAYFCSTSLGCVSGEKLKFPAWLGNSKNDAEIDQDISDQALAKNEFREAGLTTSQVAAQVSGASADNMQLASAVQYAQPTGLVTLQKGQDLQQMLAAAQGPVLLDFYADWCAPCRKQGKILDQVEPIVAQNGATIIKINVDEHPRIKRDFQVSALPTLVVVKNGQVATRKKGLTNETQLVSWLSN